MIKIKKVKIYFNYSRKACYAQNMQYADINIELDINNTTINTRAFASMCITDDRYNFLTSKKYHEVVSSDLRINHIGVILSDKTAEIVFNLTYNSETFFERITCKYIKAYRVEVDDNPKHDIFMPGYYTYSV
jgi:hypothetical protein